MVFFLVKILLALLGNARNLHSAIQYTQSRHSGGSPDLVQTSRLQSRLVQTSPDCLDFSNPDGDDLGHQDAREFVESVLNV